MAHFLIPSLEEIGGAESLSQKSKKLFIERVASAVGFKVVEDAAVTSTEDARMRSLFSDLQKLKMADIVSTFSRVDSFPDEPRFSSWSVHGNCGRCGGTSSHSDYEALRAATSEALERYLWSRETDYFKNGVVAPFRDLTSKNAIDPLRFAGYSASQRIRNPDRLHISDDAKFLWIDGYSLTRERPLGIPAQIVSGLRPKEPSSEKKESRIRDRITTGLATHSTKTEAVLGGALEVIERDAFMIMWLNKLSLPRITITTITRGNVSLKDLLYRCARYQLDVHFVLLATDAPVYAIMAVVLDPHMLTPVEVGLAAHTNASRAAEKALLEALRARKNARARVKEYGKPFTKKSYEVNFGERHLYWADPSRTKDLDFLTQGEEISLKENVWDQDDPEAHLKHVVEWCRRSGYECVSVDLGRSKKNVLGLDVVFVVIPELQPLYLNEARRYEGGERLKTIPKKFGYAPRETLFTDVPHPFV